MQQKGYLRGRGAEPPLSTEEAYPTGQVKFGASESYYLVNPKFCFYLCLWLSLSTG